MGYSIVIKGGEVLDPTGVTGRLDVALAGDTIAAIMPDIPAASADRVIDASGQYVTPGLIDMHTHIFRGVGYWGVDADALAWTCGVTTWVDAGSSGALSFPGFREFIADSSLVRVYAFVSMSYLGILGLNYDEYASMATLNPDVLARVYKRNSDIIIGIKVRMGTGPIGHRGLGPLERARDTADELGLPIMCHIAAAPPPIEDILKLLRQGDILTHSFTGQSHRLIDSGGRVLDAAVDARNRGVVIDVGHGAGSFSFETSEALSASGFWPDVISSDVHQVSLPGPKLVDPLGEAIVIRVAGDGRPDFTLLTVMNKFLHLGMSFRDVIRATTSTPAAVLGLDSRIGRLIPGALADIATFVVDEGSYVLRDVHGNARVCRRLIRNVTTIAKGRVMPRKALGPPPAWIEIVGS